MKSRLIFLFVMLLPVFVRAQTSQGGYFQVDYVRGCAPFTINIVDTNSGGRTCGLCQVAWGDGVVDIPLQTTHTYTQPGTYTIEVNYQGVGVDYISITVDPNTQPEFDIFTCTANSVQVRVTDTTYDTYVIDYGDGTTVEVPRGASATSSHTYSAAPTTRNIQVHGKMNNAADNCAFLQKSVMLRTSLPAPAISQVRVTNGTSIELTFNTLQNILYRLEMQTNGGVFQNAGTLYNVNTTTLSSLNTQNNYYCFRLTAVDPCYGGFGPYSNTVCSARLTVTAQNNANQLTWTTSTTNVTNFTLTRNGTFLATVATTTYTDNTVVCGTPYCYQVTANYASVMPGPVSPLAISAEACVTAISTNIPDRVNHVTAVAGTETVTLTWLDNPTFEAQYYTVLRQAAGGAFTVQQNNVTGLTYTDDTYTPASSYCYRVDYTDVCNNISQPGIVACPIVLTYTSANNNDLLLTWSAYTGWENGVNRYELDKYNLQHTLLETFAVGTAVTYTDGDLTDQGYYYVVRAIPNTNPSGGESISNEILAVRSLRFAYPKAFTPDGQGPAENELFKVFVTEEFISHFEMKIFNRWGEMIYSTTDLAKGWDGTFNGKPQPEGTYTFTAVLKDRTGQVFKRDGSVMLLRKK